MNKLPNEKNNIINKAGITLIALVISIVVLLILAGVSIMTLTGDNGLLTRTVGAKNKTKLAEAQEIANLEYVAISIDSRVNTTSVAATAASIADVLEKKGFTIQDKGAIITGVSLLDGTAPVTTLDLNAGDEKTLKVNTEITGDGNTEYYVQIDDKWHKIEVKSNGVEIAKEGIARLGTENSNTQQIVTISVTGMPDNSSALIEKIVPEGENITVSSSGIEVIKDDEIKVTAGSSNLTGVTITLSVTNIVENYNVAMTVFKPTIPTFSTAYGLIDVIWLGKDNQKRSTPLVEVPSGLTPIKLNSDGTYTENPADTWYDYAEKTSNVTSQWANAINPDDGSFFVWIPRYAYRITYYDKDPTVANSGAKVTGYYDGNGMWTTGANEEIILYQKLEDGIKTVTDGNKKYIVHPAFETVADLGGGFSTDSNQIAGVWVAKYEMSMENGNGQHVDTTIITGRSALSTTVKAVSKPGVSSWRNIPIGMCYTNSYNYDRDMESHLMKNSEWGAVAYLTHSQYGTNGKEIAINNSSTYITGTSGGSANASLSDTNYAYNTTEGIKASSTGNITGIYDLSGGASESVSAYNDNEDSSNKITSNGWNGLTPTTASTKYAMQYSNDSNKSNGDSIYRVGKTGDATKEVYAAKDVTNEYINLTTKRNWFDDSGSFPTSGYPFFSRGGGFSVKVDAGVFSSGISSGDYLSSSSSFRIVLAP